MKKASMETLVNFIDTHGVEELFAIKDELTAELAKGKAKADANRELYTEYHDKVMDAIRLANAPVSAQDIADATGIARGKVVHGLTKLWTSEVSVDKSGKANLYTVA